MIHESRGWVCFSSRTVPSAWHRAQHTLGVWSVIQGAGLSPRLAGRMALLKSLCNRCAAAVAKGKLIWCISPVCLFSCYTCARWPGDRVVRDSRGKGTSWAQQAPWSRPRVRNLPHGSGEQAQLADRSAVWSGVLAKTPPQLHFKAEKRGNTPNLCFCCLVSSACK